MPNRLDRWTRESRMLAWRAFLRGRYQFRRSRPDQALLVLSTYRSGSTLLIDYLNAIPGARFYGELMHTGQCRGPRSGKREDLIPFLRNLLQSNAARLTGFKIHLDQLAASEVTLPELKAFSDDTRFLLLYRRSLFRQYVSHRHALAADVWELKSPARPLFVEPEALLDYCDKIRAAYHDARERLSGEVHLTLAYEDLCEMGPSGFASALRQFAGTPLFQPKSRLRKQAGDLRREIANYSEVERWIDHPRTRLELAP